MQHTHAVIALSKAILSALGLVTLLLSEMVVENS